MYRLIVIIIIITFLDDLISVEDYISLTLIRILVFQIENLAVTSSDNCWYSTESSSRPPGTERTWTISLKLLFCHDSCALRGKVLALDRRSSCDAASADTASN